MYTPIDMTKIVPLVTGGGSGIGLGLVHEFLKYGCPKVLITGRREAVLVEAAESAVGAGGKIQYKVSDAGNPQDREELLEWVKEYHPDCNALVNNAGIQRRIAPVNDNGTWAERATEIEINVCGPIHLCTLFVPYFLSKGSGQVCLLANVSSGLAFVPFAGGPVYSATKAALHNYTMALRYSLDGDASNVRVVEIVPPAVKSNLGGSHDFGEECDEYCESTMARVAAGEPEVGFRTSETWRLADRTELDAAMLGVASGMHVPKYDGDK